MPRQPNPPLEADIHIPPEIQHIPPDALKLLFPDIAVSAQPKPGWPINACNRVTFTVTLRPGFRPPNFPPLTGSRTVKVHVIDKISGTPTIVAEVFLQVPAAGGSTTACVEWPMPKDAKFTPDFSNEITIVVDPDNSIIERQETNNKVTISGTCVG